jgi:hypothetical protein
VVPGGALIQDIKLINSKLKGTDTQEGKETEEASSIKCYTFKQTKGKAGKQIKNSSKT